MNQLICAGLGSRDKLYIYATQARANKLYIVFQTEGKVPQRYSMSRSMPALNQIDSYNPQVLYFATYNIFRLMISVVLGLRDGA